MLNGLRSAIRQKPSRVLLALAVLLAGANAVLAATALQNAADARQLTKQVVNLRDSLEQLRRVEQVGLQGLQAQAIAEEARLAELRAGFPKLGEPFDVFRRGFTLASLNQVELESIERRASSLLETPVGPLSTTGFGLHASGELDGCLGFIGDLESAGLTTLAVQGLNLAPADLRCDFEVMLASAAPSVMAPEYSAAEGTPWSAPEE